MLLEVSFSGFTKIGFLYHDFLLKLNDVLALSKVLLLPPFYSSAGFFPSAFNVETQTFSILSASNGAGLDPYYMMCSS